MRSWIRLLLLALLLAAAMPAAAGAVRTESGAEAEGHPQALRYGDRGAGVERLQWLLADQGYKPGPVDGIFGPLTLAAVLRAQSALNLETDGIAGSLTSSALEKGNESILTSAAPRHPSVMATAALEEGGPGLLAPAAAAHRKTAAGGSAVATASGLVIHQGVPSLPAPAKEVKEFALTFNGIPEPDLLPRILGVLEQHRAEATFFIPGRAAVLRPELVARITAAGHELGNGGLENIDMSRLSPEMVQAQLTHAQRLIAAATGQRPALFRPPFGRFGQTLTAGAAEAGLRTALWTNLFSGSDLTRGRESLAEEVYPGAVIMLYQDRPATVDRLETALAELTRLGYSSVRLSRLVTCEVCR